MAISKWKASRLANVGIGAIYHAIEHGYITLDAYGEIEEKSLDEYCKLVSDRRYRRSTLKQRLLNFIVGYRKQFDMAPTMREMTAAMVQSDNKTITATLDELELDGKIKRIPGKHRGIMVVGGQWSYQQKGNQI